ncbi:galactokinase [Humibacillus sp. DSM 29435]|uniref:galactokinase n=1 Tax=Humibacillus sp. DSM 29435 TaxID=1869167 RepID=UPI0009F4B55C|nr:galactokinase [Humibacillus sp. DSM 29435]
MSTPPSELTSAAVALFTATYAAPPEGVWSAPGRVNLIGEHVDYNGGLCLPMAIPQRTHAAVRRRDDRMVHVISGESGVERVALDDIGPGSPSGWAAYVAGVFWALEQAGHVIAGADIALTSDVPSGAGLSSSAALEASVALAIDELCGLGLGGDDAGRRELATACQRAENEVVGAPTGGMDQAASLRGRAGHALELDCRTMDVAYVPFEQELLIIDTRAHHALVDGQYAARREQCESAARDLGVPLLADVSLDGLSHTLEAVTDPVARRRARHVVTEIGRVKESAQVLRQGDRVDLDALGALFTASHVSLRDDFEVSCAELDVAVEAAIAAGAFGARMTGGGFGGSAIALVRPGRSGAVVAGVRRAYQQQGWKRPRTFRVKAGAGAGRDDTSE